MTKYHHLKRKYNKKADDLDSLRLKHRRHPPSFSTVQPNVAHLQSPNGLAAMVSPYLSPQPARIPGSVSQNKFMDTTLSLPTSMCKFRGQLSFRRRDPKMKQKFINQESPMPTWSMPGPKTGAAPLNSKELGTNWFGYKILQSSDYFQQYRHPSELTSRIILDSMCHSWGLYFAPNPDMCQGLGSCDIQLALEASFEVVPDAEYRSAELEPVGQLMFGSVLLARLLVLQLFLEELTSENILQRRKKWVIAQQVPCTAFCRLDIFALLSQDIRAILPHDDIVLACHCIWQYNIGPLLRTFSGDSHVSLSVVLDWGDQAVPQKAPRAKRPLAMRAGLSCWTSIFPFNSGVEFKVVCDELLYLLIPDYVLELSTKRHDRFERLPCLSGSHQFRNHPT
ncbi:hypothetical protein DL96DRAFT_1557354 [Flagelloscypha sp. PMI_526]|nr:hypothetical protein DL96DRAFT_1557354 [Flagelloscypha sp. PMI_526]